MLPGRKGKQCRERWHNHLNPDIIKVGGRVAVAGLGTREGAVAQPLAPSA